MALALANKHATNGIPRRVNGADATVYTTDSGGAANDGIFTPGANSLLVAVILADTTGSPPYEDPTVSGNGVSYSQVVGQENSGFGELHLYVADSGSSPTSGAVSATWSVARIGCHLYAMEFTGADMTSGAAAAIRNVVSANGPTGTSKQITLGAAGNANNRMVSCYARDVNETTTGDLDAGTWVTICDQGHNNPQRRLLVQWRSDATDTDHDASWTTSSTIVSIGFEIIAAGGGGGGAVSGDPLGMSGFFG